MTPRGPAATSTLRLVLLALAGWLFGVPATAAAGEIVIEIDALKPSALSVAVDEPVAFVNRSGRLVHVEFAGPDDGHHVLQVPGADGARMRADGAEGYSVGVVVTLPVFDGFLRENAVNTAKARLDRAVQAEGLARQQIAREVNQAALIALTRARFNRVSALAEYHSALAIVAQGDGPGPVNLEKARRQGGPDGAGNRDGWRAT